MMRAKTLIIMAAVRRNMRIESVSWLSMTSISLEKRLVMRPRGVVSKKDMGARRTLCMAWCSMTLEASVPPKDRTTENKNMSKAWAPPKPA